MSTRTYCFWCSSKVIATLIRGRLIYDCGNEASDHNPYDAGNRTPLCNQRQGELLACPIETAPEALKRLASSNAFLQPRALDNNRDAELIARLNFATAAVAKLEDTQ